MGGVDYFGDANLLNKIIAASMLPGGKIGVGLFFMISGFFLCDEKTVKIKKTIKICFETAWIIAIFSVLSYVCFGGIGCYRIQDNFAIYIFDNFFRPISSGQWWFATTYIVLAVLSPGLNYIIQKSDEFIFLVLFIYVWLYVFGNIGSIQYQEVQLAIFFYMLGAYWAKHGIDFFALKNMKINILLAGMTWIISTVICYFSALSVAHIVSPLFEKICDGVQIAVIVPIEVVLIFSIFDHITLNSTVINKIAAHTFGIYLIHDSLVGRDLLWDTVFKVGTYQYGSRFFALLAPITIVTVFIICGLIDHVRERISTVLASKINCVFQNR